jgi:PAS domain S-box-containing protein
MPAARKRRLGFRDAGRRGFAAGVLLACLFASGAFGAKAAGGLDPSKALTQLGVDTWMTEHGLPSATVTAVRDTADGYMWLGTYDGLARFDGTRFTVFTQADGLGNNGVRALCEDRVGGLWVGTNGGGVVRLDRGRFRRFTTADGLPSDIVWSLHADVRDGSIWMGTNGGGLARWRGGRFERFDPRGSGRSIAGIAQEQDGTLWLATQGDGLRRLSPDGTFSTYGPAEGLPRGLVAGVAVGRDGTVWGATSTGPFLLREGKVAPLPRGLEPLGALILSSVVEDALGTLWFGTNGSGVARFAEGRLSFLGLADGVGDAVYALHADRDGRIWAGTNGAGASRLRDGSFTTYAAREGLSRDFSYTTFQDSRGTLWAGSAGGLDRFDGAAFVPASPPFGKTVAVRSIAEGPDGALWIGSYGAGVWRLQGGRWQGFSSRDGLAHDTVRAVLADREGRIWAATNGGLSVLEGGAWRSFRAGEGLPSDSLIGLAEDREGNLWIGSDGAGLTRLSDGVFRTFTSRDGLASEVVLALHVDAGGALWVATNGGLSRLAGERFESLSTADGLPSDSVTQVVEDARGDLWLGTSRGVSRISRASLEAAFRERSGSLEVESFDQLDGMKSSYCTAPGQPSASRSRDGRVWFATTRGVACIDPAQPRATLRPPSALIEEVLLDGEPVPFDGGVAAPPGTTRVEVRFSKLSPLAPQRTAVRFRLEGFDPGWIDAGDRRRADYTHVPPGAYTFRIAARTGTSDWNEAGAGLPVRIRPRFYQTWPFALAASVAAVGLLFVGHRLRVRALAARGRELSLMVEERTEELRRQGSYLTSLHETALAIMDRLEPKELLRDLVERAAALLGAPEGFLYLEEEGGERLARSVWAGARPRDEFVSRGEGAVGRTWESGEAVVVDDYDAFAERVPEVPTGVFGALMTVPLRFEGRVRGVLGIVRLRGAERFTAAEVRLLASFAELASVALDNARLFEALKDELAERTRVQEELAESELRFRQLAENIDALFFIGSTNPPRFLYVSPGFERIWGRPATLSRREFLDSIHPDDRDAVTAAIGRQGEGYDLEYRIVRPDGSLRWVHARVFPIPEEEGPVLRVAGIVEDVSVRKSVEQMRDDLVRTLVHDLKNPLGSMLASIEVLEASLSGPESRQKAEVVRIARRGGIKLRNLVDAILDVGRLEQGAMPLALSPVDLAAAVEEAFDLQRPLAEPKKLKLVSTVAADVPPVRADRELLSRILQNLVGNAVKFVPDGGEIRVGAVREDGGMLRVTVADDGPGLPADLRERIFDRFVTGRHAASGSGLGLTFCRLAVEAQGGRISAESGGDGGARFVFTLPEAGAPPS